MRRQRGFTLIELVAVIALIAAIAGGLAVSLGGANDGQRMRSAAREVASELQYARGQALLRGESQVFEIDVDSREWQASSGRRGRLPGAISVSVLTISEETPGEGVAGIRFFPDGSSTGGVVRLSIENAEIQVEVAWLTGSVRITRGEG